MTQSERPRHSVSVAAVVTDEQSRVLVVQRRDTGKWEIPGGILELNESVHAGVRREVEEETGVTIEPERLTGVYKNLRLGVVALVFRARVTSGTPGPTEESAAIDWWTSDEVTEQMSETFAVRVLDALDTVDVAIRLHNGVSLLTEEIAPEVLGD
ncbi:NUDIX hydrolase [Actinoplanes couchii]|uniref:NUDIX hydrolase n=1 Tax=Actinoplanes couchii TaxID=403638 RepID=A0ABQ3X3E5_9ACTN|nr:NUDIX hydrolase [Actinoplanes couchii]MDR6322796.1 8-oxo-dGTP pyrophosphatase MutT (NUDIX family) [Actinoplanes couchii]GID53035.1 NUDIX hydrolase [Actinoplanes couchii]